MSYATSKTKFRREMVLLDAAGATKAGLLILGVADPNAGAIPVETGVIGVGTDYSLWVANATTWTLITGGSGGLILPDDTYLQIGTSADSKLGYDSGTNTVVLQNATAAAAATALLTVRTQGTSVGSSGAAAFGSGDATGAATSGIAVLRSGATATGGSGAVVAASGVTAGGASGAANFGSGAVTGAGASGNVILTSGATTGAGSSGSLSMASGATSGAATSGAVVLASGATTGAAASGSLGISTGNSTLAASGALTLSTGNGGTSAGTILINPGLSSAGGGAPVEILGGAGTTGTGYVALATVVAPINTNSGYIQGTTGNATGTGRSGSINFETGTAATTALRGDVILGGRQLITPSAQSNAPYIYQPSNYYLVSVAGGTATSFAATTDVKPAYVVLRKTAAISSGAETVSITVNGTPLVTYTMAAALAVGECVLVPCSPTVATIASGDTIALTTVPNAGNAACEIDIVGRPA